MGSCFFLPYFKFKIRNNFIYNHAVFVVSGLIFQNDKSKFLLVFNDESLKVYWKVKKYFTKFRSLDKHYETNASWFICFSKTSKKSPTSLAWKHNVKSIHHTLRGCIIITFLEDMSPSISTQSLTHILKKCFKWVWVIWRSH